ncbi:MAG: helix-turn-helix domain-containing protein [Clostridia bacterium]|nr:helix-turn-helix domain-containing protein [Clostridia bacterium]
MSTRLFQGMIHQMRTAIDRIIGVVDDSGIVIACSELGKIGEMRQGIREELTFSSETVKYAGFTYKPLVSGTRGEYIVFVEGEDLTAERYASILAVALANVKNLYDEKYDKAAFLKNVIMDNILPTDIYMRSKAMHFEFDVQRVVMVIKFLSETEVLPYDMVQNLFPNKNKDFVISIGEKDIVLIKDVRGVTDMKEIEKIAVTLADTINTEFFARVAIGIGSVSENIKDLARSFKEAQVAIEVGKVFDTERNIVSYENLGIGRLIYQLPTTLCEMFLHEVFKEDTFELLDRETLSTIQCFFENNLNVSETSRKMFVHRNTLVYRLEKINKLTGLDLREFDNAITFKVALMVKRYLQTKSGKYGHSGT